MPPNSPLSFTLLDVIATHILQVSQQLNQAMQSETQSLADEQQPLSIIMVSDNKINEGLSHFFKINDSQLAINFFSVAEFINLPYDKRYTLGCLVDPSCLHLANEDTSAASAIKRNSAHSEDLNKAAIRLRDLFAGQSLLLTYIPISELSFNCLGYIPMAVPTPDALPELQSWQFNLYDYKQRPDWLNSRYWANPENFDKFRW